MDPMYVFPACLDHISRVTLKTIPGPSQSYYNVSLVNDQDLDAIGYRYHPVYRIFICVSCKTCTRHQHIRSHLKDKHQHPCSFATLDKIITAHPPHQGFHPALPSFDNGQPAIALPILPLRTGYTCTLCHFSGLTLGGIRNHFTSQHVHHVYQEHHCVTLLQAFYSQGQRALFPVQPLSGTPLNQVTPFTAFLKDRERDQPVAAIQPLGDLSLR